MQSFTSCHYYLSSPLCKNWPNKSLVGVQLCIGRLSNNKNVVNVSTSKISYSSHSNKLSSKCYGDAIWYFISHTRTHTRITTHRSPHTHIRRVAKSSDPSQHLKSVLNPVAGDAIQFSSSHGVGGNVSETRWV